MNRLFLQGILLLQGSFFSLLFSSSPSLISLYLLAALCFACLMELCTASKGALVLSCLSLCAIPFFRSSPVISRFGPSIWSGRIAGCVCFRASAVCMESSKRNSRSFS